MQLDQLVLRKLQIACGRGEGEKGRGRESVGREGGKARGGERERKWRGGIGEGEMVRGGREGRRERRRKKMKKMKRRGGKKRWGCGESVGKELIYNNKLKYKEYTEYLYRTPRADQQGQILFRVTEIFPNEARLHILEDLSRE